MARKGFKPEQIIHMLREAEVSGSGKSHKCHQAHGIEHGFHGQTFYKIIVCTSLGKNLPARQCFFASNY